MPTIPHLDLPARTSKKQQIYDALLARIRDNSLPIGTRLPSTSALAQEWCVAHATAHAVLTELTREGWLVRYPKHGTFVSTPPREEKELLATTAVLVLPPRRDIVASGNAEAVFEMLQGLTQGASEVGWQIRIESIPSHPPESDLQRAREAVAGAQAAIFISSQYRSLIRQVASGNASVTILGSDCGMGTSITYDRKAGVRTALEHLVKRGCRKIGFFGRAVETGPDDKFKAYREILLEFGLAMDERWVHHPETDLQPGADIRKFFKTGPECDALFIPNYRLASALAHEARHAGIRIPENLALVALGIEGSNTDEIPLTYLRVPFLEFGLEAMKRIASRSASPTRETVLLQPELVVRASA